MSTLSVQRLFSWIVAGVLAGGTLASESPRATGTAAPSPGTFRYTDNLGGIPSPYTAALIAAVADWPPPDIDYARSDPNPVWLSALSTPDNPYYIGVEQVMAIEAPVARVDHVLRDIDHYVDYFPGYKDIHVVSRDGQRFLTSWEQIIPIPLVSNVKYDMRYGIDESQPGRVIFRYQLQDSNRLKVSDGVIVLEGKGDHTRYTEYDFFDADYGIAKAFGSDRIWSDSLEGFYLSDVGIKLRAEHKGWPFSRVRSESAKYLKLYPIDPVLKSRKRFYKLSIAPK
jgi:hypothetical protein